MKIHTTHHPLHIVYDRHGKPSYLVTQSIATPQWLSMLIKQSVSVSGLKALPHQLCKLSNINTKHSPKLITKIKQLPLLCQTWDLSMLLKVGSVTHHGSFITAKLHFANCQPLLVSVKPSQLHQLKQLVGASLVAR